MPSGSLGKEIKDTACFGVYTNNYEYLIFILWGVMVTLGVGILAFFCTSVCKRCKERAEDSDDENETEGSVSNERRGRKSTSI